MARKSAKKDRKKTGTNAGATQRQATLGITVGPAQPSAMFAVPQVLSLMNRRLYRQARTYRCKVNISQPNVDMAPINVYALANTWWVRKAIQTAHEMYGHSIKDELEAGIDPSRWHDFRINATIPATDTLKPFMVNYIGTTWENLDDATGEYLYTGISTASGPENELDAAKATAVGTYNIFEEYRKMGASQEDPAVALTGGYNDAAGYDITVETQQDLLQEGNVPPYNVQNPEQVWVLVGQIGRNAAGESITSTGYFDAPLGWVYIPNYTAASPAALNFPLALELEVQAGDYKGVLADEIVSGL